MEEKIYFKGQYNRINKSSDIFSQIEKKMKELKLSPKSVNYSYNSSDIFYYINKGEFTYSYNRPRGYKIVTPEHYLSVLEGQFTESLYPIY